jgi:hypothetical protein
MRSGNENTRRQEIKQQTQRALAACSSKSFDVGDAAAAANKHLEEA